MRLNKLRNWMKAKQATDYTKDISDPHRTLIYRKRYDNPVFQQLLHYTDEIMNSSSAVMLKDGDTTTVVKVRCGAKDFIIKRYNVKNKLHALKRAIQRSRATRVWQNTQRLKNCGISTHEPAAIIVNKKYFGYLNQTAYFISEYVNAEPIHKVLNRQHINEQEKQNMLRALEKLFSALHQHLISHGDMKASNFLWDGEKIYLIDLDSMRQHKTKRSFMRAWRKDMQRFDKNWRDDSKLQHFFSQFRH